MGEVGGQAFKKFGFTHAALHERWGEIVGPQYARHCRPLKLRFPRGQKDGGTLARRAVTTEVEWNDPRDSFVGIDELERAIRRLRTSKPDYAFRIVSESDANHHRLRYRWDMTRRGRTLMEGLDVVTLAPSGLIERVDGFFGHPTPARAEGSGVPASLRG